MTDENTLLILNSIEQFKNSTNANFDKINKRLDEHDKRFDNYDKQFEAINKRLDEHDTKFDNHDKLFESINQRLLSLENIVTRIEVEHGEKIQILLDCMTICMKNDEEIIKILNDHISKLDNHEIRIQILEEKVL